MLDDNTPYRGSFQQLADARRVLKIADNLSKLPILPAEDRHALKTIRSHAIRCVGAAVEELIETLDVLQGDTDLEDATDVEDEGIAPQTLAWLGDLAGPGCEISDPDSGVEDRPHDWDERERDEGDCGHTRVYGVDQTRPIGPDNPEVA